VCESEWKKNNQQQKRVWLYKERKFSSAFSLQSFVYLRLQQRSIRHLLDSPFLFEIRQNSRVHILVTSAIAVASVLLFSFYVIIFFSFISDDFSTWLLLLYNNTNKFELLFSSQQRWSETDWNIFPPIPFFVIKAAAEFIAPFFFLCIAATEYRLI
jgi:hypothetical protein